MCQAIREMVEDSRMEGRMEGRMEDRMEDRMEGMVRIYVDELQLSADEIAVKLQLDADTVKQIMDEIKK